MKNLLSLFIISVMASSCAQLNHSDKRAVASESKVIEQPDLLASMMGRKPTRTLTDLINEGASADELSRYKFYAIHPVMMAGYYPVNIISEKGNGYYILESKAEVQAVTDAIKTSDNQNMGPGIITFNKKFSDHSNNIIFEMPNGSFNRPDFVVGKKVCTDKKKSAFSFCGTITRIYSSGELLIKLKKDYNIVAVELF